MSRPLVQGFTIDGERSKDLDDAIWVDSLPDGWLLTISIADAAERVAKESSLDQSAARKVETRYHREGNTPMLPRRFAEDELSLLEGQPRDVLAVIVEVGLDGTPREVTLQEASLVSRAQLSHKTADRILQEGDPEIQAQFKLCQRVADALLARRQAMGACALYDFRRGIYADEDGAIRTFSGSAHAQMVVQEFMILANEQVAIWMAKAGRAFLFRNHQARPSSPERGEVIRQINDALLHPSLLPALQERLTLWMERAAYGTALLGHYALSIPAYTHFTSPIRRYADLVNHRIVKAALRGDPEPYTRAELDEVASRINAWREEQIEATAEWHRTAAVQDRRKLLDAVAALDGPDFSRVLEQALKDDTPTPAILEALGSRDLAPVDLFWLFFRGGAGWDDARRTILSRLWREPHKAVMALEITRQKDQAVLEPEIHPFKGEFLGLQRVTYGGRFLAHRTPVRASTKKGALAFACVAWLEGRVEKTLVSPDEVQMGPGGAEVTPAPDAQAPPDGRNYVGMLNEWCQQRQVAPPAYEFKAQGPSHQPEFLATVTVNRNGSAQVVSGTPAATKQDAKRNAASSLWAWLNRE